MQNKPSLTLKDAKKERALVINLWGHRQCGFVFNADFREKLVDYSMEYDNTPDYSSRFHNYVKDIARRLYGEHRLEKKSVLEIGCGKGNFLKLLYSLGARDILGFDPAYEINSSVTDGLVIRKLFNKNKLKEKVDFIICREVLEHISKPYSFIRDAISVLKDGGVMYFEVPSLDWIIKNETFFDFTYEHCNYFTKAAISKLFNQFGFGNISFTDGVDGQYIQAEISKGRAEKPILKSLPTPDFSNISRFINQRMKEYKDMINTWGRFVVWGVAGKGVTFLNCLGISREVSPYAIDINPQKHGKFVPITGQKIVGPELLRKERIDNIIIMNPIYSREIKMAARKYGYSGRYSCPILGGENFI
ncbi:MAG: class I SAM-dependent methyltransferase [bacterium]|nr:class I SAM-dependent methyltransferase [bacterium]